MPEFGLTADGFRAKDEETIAREMQNRVRSLLGIPEGAPLGSAIESVIAIYAERIAQQWQVAEAIYQSQDPDQADGEALDVICSWTGTVRLPATASEAEVVCTGDANTTLSAGRVVSHAVSGARFESTEEAELEAADEWQAETEYAEGDFVTNDDRIYVATEGGTSGEGDGPQGESPDTDGTVEWQFVGDGEAFAVVDFRAEDTGPTEAAAGTLTEIETPVGGWQSASNLEAAEVGRNRETDDELLNRRLDRLRALGRGTLEAIRQRLLDITEPSAVDAAVVFENVMDVEVDGMPPHSIEALVDIPEGSEQDEAVARVLLESKAAGIETHGTVSVVIEDEDGQERTIRFSRPTLVDVFVDVEYTPQPGVTVSESDIRDRVVNHVAGLGIGQDVFASQIVCEVFKVAGVQDVTVRVGLSAGPDGSVVVIGDREKATVDNANDDITVGQPDES